MLLVLPRRLAEERGQRVAAGSSYVFEPVEILVALAADVALEGLLLLHSESPRVGGRGLGVNDGESAVAVLM